MTIGPEPMTRMRLMSERRGMNHCSRRGKQSDRRSAIKRWYPRGSGRSAKSASKKREPRRAPSRSDRSPKPSRDSAAGSSGDLAGVQATRADLDLLNLAIEFDADHLKIWLPGATSLVVRMRHVVAEGHAFGAHVADVALNSHGLGLGRFGRAVPDQRRREIAKQREALLARSAKLPPRLLVPH